VAARLAAVLAVSAPAARLVAPVAQRVARVAQRVAPVAQRVALAVPVAQRAVLAARLVVLEACAGSLVRSTDTTILAGCSSATGSPPMLRDGSSMPTARMAKTSRHGFTIDRR
jgi:hypothetical protein